MIHPYIALWLKQANSGTGDCVQEHLTIRLATVARRAGEAEVFENSFSTCRSWNNVLDLKRGDGQTFWRAAIRTAVTESLANSSL
jgi:hypothetical protein